MTDANKNIFDDINANKAKISKNVKKTVNEYLPYILLVANIVFRIILQLYDPKLVNPFSVVFVLDTITSLISTMFCYIVFIPQGELNERKTSLSYRPNCERWGELSSKIRTSGRLEAFRKYCNLQVELERKATRESIIANNTTYSYSEYEEQFAKLNKKELKQLKDAGKITSTDYKAFLKANSNIKIKPINSVLILSGVAHASYNDAGRDDGNYAAKWLIKRPLPILFTSILLNALSGSFIGLSGYSVIYSMVIDALFIVVASFVGYGVGVQSVQAENNKIKNRILFIESFLEGKTDEK